MPPTYRLMFKGRCPHLSIWILAEPPVPAAALLVPCPACGTAITLVSDDEGVDGNGDGPP